MGACIASNDERRALRRRALFIATLIPTLVMCGARTGLDVLGGAIDDAGAVHTMPGDERVDATTDARGDARSPERDAQTDAKVDANAGPGIDGSTRDGGILCAAREDTRAYLVGEDGAFYRFDVSTLVATPLGTPACPIVNTPGPFTMTVARNAAYVLYSDGTLFRVDLATLACTKTAYVDEQLGFPTNVALATAPSGDALLVYGCLVGRTPCLPTLARADLTRFELVSIGPITPTPMAGYPPDIKTDGFGRLFACDQGGTLLEIDPANGALLGTDATGLVVGPALAVLTYGRDLYFIAGAMGTVSRYDLSTKHLTQLGAIGTTIVGAGAAPCLP